MQKNTSHKKHINLIIIIIIFIIIIIIVLRKLVGKPWGFSAQDAILCQNGGMSYEKNWNDLHIYVKSGVIVYQQPRTHNSVGWGMVKGWCIAPA